MRLADIPARLRPAPQRVSDAIAGDHVFSPDLIAERSPEPAKPAAVLIPIIDRREPSVLFTRRTASLRNHSGQIAFPGGRIDPGDDGALGAALREADEEIGLDRSHVEPLGYLDLYQSTTGYLITPVVARVVPGFALTLNAGEVAETFEVPLAFLLDPTNNRYETREWRGKPRTYLAIPYGERYIWGVTAGILLDLQTRLTA